MSIETKIDELISALNTLTAAVAGKGGTAPAKATAAEPATPAEPAKRGRPAKTPAPSVSKAEMQAAVNEVKEAFDVATAKALITQVGFAKLADVTEAKYKELYDLAKAKMTELGDGDADGDGDDDM